jgi:monoamine oxidase
MFGENIPDPIGYTISRWKSDIYCQGTYSYIAVGSTGEDYEALARDVNGKVYFAGEATTREHPATAAGAYLSGLRCCGNVITSFEGKSTVRLYPPNFS